jgi:hypothetical protein
VRFGVEHVTLDHIHAVIFERGLDIRALNHLKTAHGVR